MRREVAGEILFSPLHGIPKRNKLALEYISQPPHSRSVFAMCASFKEVSESIRQKSYDSVKSFRIVPKEDCFFIASMQLMKDMCDGISDVKTDTECFDGDLRIFHL
jgi:hypothetical protein